jgi:hypothetical protein
MLIRHILVEPQDHGASPTTACLIDAWLNVTAKAGAKVDVVDEAGAIEIFKGNLPPAIPRGHPVYPREVLIQVASALRVTE